MLKSLYTSLLILALFLTSCGSKKQEETATAVTKTPEHEAEVVEFSSDQYNAVGIQLGNVTNTNLSNYIKASGTIKVPPQQLISITSPYGGIVKTTSILEGKYIGQGQIVATIENPEFLQIQQDYLESNSQLSFLQQDLARQEELVKENIAARKSLQKASSEYNTINARVEGLKAKLKMINVNPESVRSGNFTSRVNIYSPQGGYVTKVLANIGKFVGPNEVVADIANTNNMLVSINVFEKDIPRISVGQKIRFRATGDTVERLAIITLMGKDIHEDRTIEVQARITTPSSKLFPGMFVNAILEIGAAATLALPQQAVVQAGGKNYIFVLEETFGQHKDPKPASAGKKDGSQTKEEASHYAFRRVEIAIGVTENGFTAVILPEKFDLQKKVVIKGAYDLLSKMNNSAEEE
ncbi:MAG: efflux RND transporter periplasmic adaptor subunit [Bacteroidetes bacterium]|nr:efflux RND transporter periplasmic adaptor subunit [Bacteroidota bacterium]